MTTTQDPRPSSTPTSRWRAAVEALLPACLLALVATAISSGLLGATLGLFFAGIFVCALLVPPMVVGENDWTHALLAALGAWLGVSLVWLEVTFRGHSPGYAYPDVPETLACIVIAGAFVLALAGTALLLRHVRLPLALASFVTILIALAWLAWPVWASPWVGGHDRLV